MTVYVGSARIDERGAATNGKAGDQKQTSTPDYVGEVSQQKFYVHTKGWNILRAKKDDVAQRLADSMIRACNNSNLGYDQNQRLGVVTNGTGSTIKTECDCSSLVRRCILEALGVDPGNFTTGNEATVVMKTGAFDKIPYKSGDKLYTGDILVTKTKGHTVIVTQGNPRVVETAPTPAPKPATTTSKSYYPRFDALSITDGLRSIGVNNSMTYRKKIAAANGISNYTGRYEQNVKLLNLARQGKLVRA